MSWLAGPKYSRVLLAKKKGGSALREALRLVDLLSVVRHIMDATGLGDARVRVGVLDQEGKHHIVDKRGRWADASSLLVAASEGGGIIAGYEVVAPNVQAPPLIWLKVYETSGGSDGAGILEAAFREGIPGVDAFGEYLDRCGFEFRVRAKCRWSDRRFGNPINLYLGHRPISRFEGTEMPGPNDIEGPWSAF